MLVGFIKKIIPEYLALKQRTVFLLLFLVSLFVRLPFFFRDYIDRDESTFILMGQSWVDGHLPYTELWDLKPPITFLFFAGIIYIFGKSFVAIRLVGALIVAITAFYSYKIAVTTVTKKVGLWVALGCVALQSMFGSLQGVMSEHIGVVFFLPALYIIIKHKNTLGIFVSGILTGLSVMTKLNMAYVALALGIYILFYELRKKNYGAGIAKGFFFGLGISLVIFLTFLPYYIEGSSGVWWKSVVSASLEYAGSRRYSLASFLPLTITLGTFFYFGWKKKLLNFTDRTTQILSLTVLAILFTFIKGGRINGHYLIQLHPIFIILFGIWLSKVAVLKQLNYKPYVLILVLLLPAESYLEYYRILANKAERGTFFNGEGITVPHYIKKNNIATENILFFEYHIGYWRLNAKPPVKSATHPSTICRYELFPFFENPRKTAVEELKYIMEEIKPKTVVTRKNRSIFDPLLVEENLYINGYLSEFYERPQTVDQAEIFVRSE